jgi:HD superfamily phosphohydrolase
MIIRDVVHNDIEITEAVIIDLISTSEFQRLRKIKQLGLSYMVFPSTEHSRYTHSIGVYHMTLNFIASLEKNADKKFDEDEKLALSIAALLHDIGHGPLSHTSEELFKFNHEEYSVMIIENKNTDINSVLKYHCPRLINQVVLYIKKLHPNSVLNKILSGTIDVDRMDYLLRDSHHAGVEYGKFDSSRMIQIIDVHNEELIYHEKGIHTIEDFIMSRYHMFSQVYLNQKAIGYEKLARRILKRAKYLFEDEYRFETDINLLKPFFLDSKIEVVDYLLMNDFVLLNIIDSFARVEKDIELSDLANGFIKQKLLLEKTDKHKDYYVLQSETISKKIYNESVNIKMNDGSIKRLEEVSNLVKFIDRELKIKHPANEFYLEKNEK